MKVWITKYALTSGIFEAEVEICNDTDNDMIKLTRPGHYTEYFHGNGRDWHTSKESVSKRLAFLKERKIASLKKELKKIESITF